MKIVVTSDWHLDAVTAGVPRFAEVERAVQQSVALAEQVRADLYLFLGDLCDPDASRAPRCVAFAIEVAAALARKGIPSRWLVGNHDVIEDGSGTSTLTPLAAASVALPGLVHVYARPMVEDMAGGIVMALPFVPRVAAYDPAAFVEECAVEPDVIIGHLNLPGVVPASESDEYARGREVWLPVEKIRARWPSAIVMNGHYHQAQTTANGCVMIPGALARLTFGEARHEPSIMVVEA